ncbi:ATP-binding protein [Paractinoplanes brasiliensis]|uniref:ATP-binding protein n=1 Tax=Paractinoplanes brasiliensis TaxID=52695 RepID=UPI00105C3ECC|nr:ATP-binding protein [Actinoplanes brasiliensis]GID33411.1 LuxR family transcriptional regulator [Actinoplanes brasiliensis]
MAPGTVRLVGRESMLSSVEAFLARVAEGAATLRLSGGPGVGKTALLDAAAVSAAAEGMVVLRAAGARPESGIDFATLHQLLHPLRRSLTSLPALSAALGFGSGAEGDLCAEIAGLLRRHAAGAPILLVIDDWHWVDPRSGEVLTDLGRTLAGLLMASVEAAGPETLDVPPLDEAHAEILLSERFPMLAASVGRRLRDQARGNPLALLELAGSLNEEQRLGRRPLPPASGRFHDLCVSRVEELPGSERRRLLLDALDDSTDRLDPLMRSAVVRSSTGEERAAAHRELARRAADEPERRARHLAETTVGADESVAASLQNNARRAMRTGDAPGAVAALLRAADLSADGARRSRRLAEAAYVGANVGGDLRTVPGLLNDARHADPKGYGSLPVAVAAAHLLFNNDGHIETAHRLLTATVDNAVAGSADDDPMLVEALYQLADVCFYAARDDLWPGLEDALSRLGPRAPDLLRMYVHTLRSPVLLTASDRLRLDTALRDSSNVQDPSIVYRISRIAIACNRLSECRPSLNRIVDDGRAGGAVGIAINAMMLLSADDMTTGRLDRADALAAEALQLCETRGYELMEGPFQVIRMMVAARRGQADGVREPAMRVAAWAVPRGVRPPRSVLRLGAGHRGNGPWRFRRGLSSLRRVGRTRCSATADAHAVPQLAGPDRVGAAYRAP